MQSVPLPPSKQPTVECGLHTGALLVITMLGALVGANRVPALERYALERNADSYGVFVLFMLLQSFKPKPTNRKC